MRSRGFTLIEIAVAMAILGVAVVSALQVFGSSVQVARVAGRKSEAIMHAKALMDSVLWAPELVADVSHGDIGDGFRWDRTIREAGPDDGIEETDAQGNVYRGDVKLAVVTVTVEWDDPSGVKSYAVQTMRIVPDTGENDNGGNNP